MCFALRHSFNSFENDILYAPLRLASTPERAESGGRVGEAADLQTGASLVCTHYTTKKCSCKGFLQNKSKESCKKPLTIPSNRIIIGTQKQLAVVFGVVNRVAAALWRTRNGRNDNRNIFIGGSGQ
jgi:hypothetical protein